MFPADHQSGMHANKCLLDNISDNLPLSVCIAMDLTENHLL